MAPSPLKPLQSRAYSPNHRGRFAPEGAATAAEAARSTQQSSAGKSPSMEFGGVSLLRRIFVSKFEVSRLLGKAREIEMKTVSGLFDVINGVDAVRLDENRHNEILISAGYQEVNPAIFLPGPPVVIRKLMVEWMGYVPERKRKLAAVLCFNQSGSIGLLFKLSHVLRHAADFLIAHLNTPFKLIIGKTPSASSPAARLDAIMLAYWHTPAEMRDAFVAVLAARPTLVAPSSISSAGAAA